LSNTLVHLAEEATLLTNKLPGELVGRRYEDELLRPALIVDSGSDRGAVLPLPNESARLVLGRAATADLRIDDRSVSRRHLILVVEPGTPRPRVALEDMGSTNGLCVGGVRVQGSRTLRDRDRIQLGDIEVIYRLLMPIDLEHRMLLLKEAREAVRDALTGCRTRRFLDRSLPTLVSAHRRGGVPLSLVIFDVDHFKAINDSHGHSVGDAALRAVAAALQGALRAQDYLVRYGGEEFVAILPGTDEDRALVAAERARCRVSELALAVAPGMAIRVSAGAGVLRDGDEIDRWFARVDDALYEAKRGGRDRVVAVGSPTAA